MFELRLVEPYVRCYVFSDINGQKEANFCSNASEEQLNILVK